MKKIIVAFCLLLSVNAVLAQTTEISRDHNGSKVLKGFITRAELSNDTAFAWFHSNQENFTPDQKAVEALKAQKDSIHILAFTGTWCDDTKNIFPKIISLADAAGFSMDQMTILGVDRNKKTVLHLSEAFNVKNVPTFIILKNGKEIGRVVEYGRFGMVDKEIGEIIINSSVQ